MKKIYLAVAITAVAAGLVGCGGNVKGSGASKADVENVDDEEDEDEEVKADKAPSGWNDKEEKEEKAETPAKPAVNLNRVTLRGKIGGKYAVVMTLNVNRRSGSYYYTKSGANNSIDLVWTDYDESDGELEMEEFTQEGNNSGSFYGKLTGLDSGNVVYSGYMINFKGQRFNFTLTGN